MAFKLKKNEAETFDDLSNALQDLETEIDDVFARYNTKVTEAKVFAEGKITEWQEEFDGKSEAWQDGDKGVAAQAFIDSWNDFVNEHEDVSLEGMTGAADAFSDLDTEVSE